MLHSQQRNGLFKVKGDWFTADTETETRVRSHVFICMLGAYLVWHLRHTWAPLTFTDQDRPTPADSVAPAWRLFSVLNS